MKMKALKKFSSFVLALVMIMAMSISALAAPVEEDPNAGEGSITISNTIAGQTYSIYRIFDLESYNADTGAYAYKINDVWKSFTSEYISVDEQGYVTWVGPKNANGEWEAEAVVTFAKAAQKYAEDNQIAPVKSEVATAKAEGSSEGNDIVFSGLKLGYYLLDSTMGTLCSLNTTNPNATINEKNEEPNLEKQVQDKEGNWGSTNDESIGDLVTFRATITAQAGAQNYIMHDKMSPGLTYVGVTGVTLKKAGAAEAVTVEAENYNVVTQNDDECTFEVKFTKEFCDTLEANDEIVVTYTATLNENAVIASTGNPNEAKLTYGEDNRNETTPSTTTTYTYEFDLIKTTDKNILLDGAEFELYQIVGEGENAKQVTLKFVKNGNVYTKANDEATGTVTTITSVANEKITIKGLENGTYYLKETKAPEGYNKLDKEEEIVINGASLTGDITITGETGNEEYSYDKEGNDNEENKNNAVQIINKTGSLLPSTGGIGTTIFYVVGGILVVAAAILLVVKKRVSHQR